MKKIQHYNLNKNCPYCHKSDIRLMSHLEFYGKEFKKNGKLYVCQNCQARVGCHPNTEIPLGQLSDEELRGLRIKIHDIIDKYWNDKTGRDIVYKKLIGRYGNPFHVGFLDNERARYILMDLKNDNKFLS